MYKMVRMEDTIRIPPNLFKEDLNEVIEDIVHKTFEGRYKKDYGVIVVTDNIEPVGEGVVIHGDGALYQRVSFDALVFMPVLQEIVDGIVCEVVEFGAFCHIGPLDALVHMSQIMNDFIEVDIDNERLIGKETKRALSVGSTIRARIVAVSMNELSPRESKIGLTMRQPALGAHEWIEEDRKKEAKKEEEAEKKGKKKKKKEKKK
ncbi:MAG TPA: DNA-directed RNA polymerase [Thermoplasmatales archaeon]|nr:DNA-directed RNA polymerase [Thermoplasmatales archaeon]